MKRFCLFILIVTTAAAAHAVDLSISLDTDGSETVGRLSEALKEWALDPVDLTACSGDCCAASDAECLGLSKEILDGGAEKVARDISPCIQNSVNFACEWWVRRDGEIEMVCEVFPATFAVVLADVAKCASQLAETRF